MWQVGGSRGSWISRRGGGRTTMIMWCGYIELQDRPLTGYNTSILIKGKGVPWDHRHIHWQSRFKVPLTRKIFISVNEVVPWVKTNGDTKSCCTYVQIGKNLQLPVAVLLKVSHFLDDVTRGTVRQVNVLQMRISAILVLYSGSETLAYRR